MLCDAASAKRPMIAQIACVLAAGGRAFLPGAGARDSRRNACRSAARDDRARARPRAAFDAALTDRRGRRPDRIPSREIARREGPIVSVFRVDVDTLRRDAGAARFPARRALALRQHDGGRRQREPDVDRVVGRMPMPPRAEMQQAAMEICAKLKKRLNRTNRGRGEAIARINIFVDPLVQVAAETRQTDTGGGRVALRQPREGDHTPDSDWDLFVVLPDDVEPGKFNPCCVTLLSDLGIPLQIYPVRRCVFDAKRGDVNSVSHDVDRDGIYLRGESHQASPGRCSHGEHTAILSSQRRPSAARSARAWRNSPARASAPRRAGRRR